MLLVPSPVRRRTPDTALALAARPARALALALLPTVVLSWLPMVVRADAPDCDPVTRRLLPLIVPSGKDGVPFRVEGDYPTDCWHLESATLVGTAIGTGVATFVVRDTTGQPPACAPGPVTFAAEGQIPGSLSDTYTVVFDETVLEADGSVRSTSTCTLTYQFPCFDPVPESTATSAAGTLTMCPAGDGPTLASAGLTVTVTLRCSGLPLAGFPGQDIWLQSVDPGAIYLCMGGLSADTNTDAYGVTTISGAPRAGRWTQGGLRAYISGIPLTNSPPLDIDLNSPDISGDGHVDLADVGPFSMDLNGIPQFRSDYFLDGTVNLADVGIFSAHLGHQCP